jgi:hypothetical protein
MIYIVFSELEVIFGPASLGKYAELGDALSFFLKLAHFEHLDISQPIQVQYWI